MCVPAQEIGLLNAAYDGDVESLNCFLEREVPVDSVSPVRNDYLIPIAPSPVNSFINGMGYATACLAIPIMTALHIHWGQGPEKQCYVIDGLCVWSMCGPNCM